MRNGYRNGYRIAEVKDLGINCKDLARQNGIVYHSFFGVVRAGRRLRDKILEQRIKSITDAEIMRVQAAIKAVQTN